MSTLSQLIDRTRREFLSPPSALPVQAPLAASVTDSATTVVYTDLLMPEEEAKIGAGTLIEIESELMRVTAIDTTTNYLTVDRGVGGTTAAAHTAPGPVIYVSPRYTRQAVADALADAVVNLYPDLFAVQTVLVDGTSGIVDLENANASHIIEAHVFTSTADWEPVRVTMLTDFPEVEVGPAVRMDDAVAQGDVYITYAYKFSRPSESTSLASLGVEEHWERIVVVSAVAALLPSVDMEKSTARYLTELLAAQGVPIGEASDLSVGMLRYRALLMDEAKRALRRRYQPQVQMRKVGSWSMGRLT